MKILLKFVIGFCIVSHALGGPVDDGSIQSKFQQMVQAVVELDAPSLVDTMHPETIKNTATYFRKELAKRPRASHVDPSLADNLFVLRIIEEAFKACPQAFSIPTAKSIRIHGVLHDGPDAFLVYTKDSEQSEFSDSASLTFRRDQDEWKLWSIPFPRLVVGTWLAQADTDKAPKVERVEPPDESKPSK
ncbi:hypothetical protein [Luteolibacter soli]|uniref:DUF4440 domain-containing protein n=1 Tax=Luteolibacter soli TaxID=3135280 RepID=A0ABU9AUF6_9BACT